LFSKNLYTEGGFEKMENYLGMSESNENFDKEDFRNQSLEYRIWSLEIKNNSLLIENKRINKALDEALCEIESLIREKLSELEKKLSKIKR
jgi:hypothetical protein